MAKNNQTGQLDPVYGGEDGFLAVQALENTSLHNYLQTYAARVEGYKIARGDNYASVTMKIAFPTCEKQANADMWAWFIAKAAHPTATKPKTMAMPHEGGWMVYVTWPIWNTVKYMESTRQGFHQF